MKTYHPENFSSYEKSKIWKKSSSLFSRRTFVGYFQLNYMNSLADLEIIPKIFRKNGVIPYLNYLCKNTTYLTFLFNTILIIKDLQKANIWQLLYFIKCSKCCPLLSSNCSLTLICCYFSLQIVQISRLYFIKNRLRCSYRKQSGGDKSGGRGDHSSILLWPIHLPGNLSFSHCLIQRM